MDSYDIQMLIQEVYDEIRNRRDPEENRRVLGKLQEVLEEFENGNVRTDLD